MNDKYASILTRLEGGGATRIGNTTATTGDIYLIKAINGPAVFSALTFENGNALTSADRLLEGDYLPGPITGFTLTSGAVLVYGTNIEQAS